MKDELIARLDIHYEQDVVHARQRARLIAQLLGFERNDQTRLSTAVSEIARNVLQYAGGGELLFALRGKPQVFAITVSDHGPGISDLTTILEGRYRSSTGLGLGIIGVRRLMDLFEIKSAPGEGVTVTFGMRLPPGSPQVTAHTLGRIADQLAVAPADSPLEEIRTQNKELLSALAELQQREEELIEVTKELTATNLGMVALYTELEQNAERLRQSERQLRARNDELKGFAYTVSHDLKAPLRGIAGYAAELDRKHRSGLSARAEFCISQILSATHNLDTLIEDLLRYSRLDAEAPLLTPVQLRRLVETILHDRELMIAEQGVELDIEIPETTVQTWERGLLQVLTNLIDNALKYSRGSSPPRVRIAAEEQAEGWLLSVSDNGIGFDQQYHDRIFGLFNRLVRSEDFEGTGAGLAIARKVIEKIDGRIWAQSAPGEGATFFVKLPQFADVESEA